MSATEKGRVRRGETGWRELVKKWEGSGLSQKVFCKHEGASLTCFKKWQRRLSVGPSVGGFIELKRKSESWEMELDLGYDVVLRLWQKEKDVLKVLHGHRRTSSESEPRRYR